MNGPLARFADPRVVRTAQIAIGALFIVAAAGKIADVPDFARQLHNYRLAPLWSENLLAAVLPWIELCAGAALVTGRLRRGGAFLVLALMLVFTVAVGSAWARGLDFHCGCFGKLGASTMGARKFAENIGLIVLAGVAAVRPKD